MLPSRTRKADLEALYEFKSLIDNLLWKDDAHRSEVFSWRLGSNIFQIIGHIGRRWADYPKHIAPRFLPSAAVDYGLRKSRRAGGLPICRDRISSGTGTETRQIGDPPEQEQGTGIPVTRFFVPLHRRHILINP